MNRPLRISGRACAWLLALAAAAAQAVTPGEELSRAISIDDLRDARRLLQDGVVDPRSTDAHGDTYLIAAIRSDATRVATYLIADPKTDLEAVNAAGETALMIAAYRKRGDLVDALLARDAHVNRPGWTALHYAASVDARDVVKSLLAHAASIDVESPNRTTPLMMAARGGFDDLSKQLVAAGADPTPKNDRDLTAADFARRANDPALADWLAERAAAWRPRPVPPGR